MRISNKRFVEKLAQNRSASAAMATDDEAEVMVELCGKIIPSQVADMVAELALMDSDTSLLPDPTAID